MNTTNTTKPEDKQGSDVNDLVEALQQKNLVYNYNFLYFSNKDGNDYKHPDGWVYYDQGTGGTITLEGESCKIFTGNDTSMTFKQALHEFPRWKTALLDKVVTVQANMILKKGCEVKVSLYDGVHNSSRSATATSQKEYVFDFDLEISPSATELTFKVETNTKDSFISISKVFANIGKIAVESLPCMVQGVIGQRRQYIATDNPPAEELSLCEEAIELSNSHTRLSSVLNFRFGEGSNKLSKLPDVRGIFSRAWDHDSKRDTDANDREMLGDESKVGDYVGTYEGDIFEEHLHELNFSPTPISVAQGSPSFGLDQGSKSSSAKTGGGETRPKNFAELYTIKWA